jgi:ligand-binding sensor domain-containing protein
MNKIVINIVLNIILPLNLLAQGQFLFKKYPPDLYRLNPQIWSITTDSTGLLYFGTSAGIVTYDGVRWSSHIPNQKNASIIRSLKTTTLSTKILFSSEDYFGWLQADSIGNLNYYYKSDELRLKNPLSNVLSINQIDSAIYFQDNRQTIKFEKDSLSSFLDGRKINKSFEFNGQLWIRDYIGGYGYFDKETDSLIYIDSKEHFIGKSVYIQIPFNQKLYFFPYNESVKYWDGNGIKTISGALSDSLKIHSVYRATVLNDSLLALGTLSGGVFITNKNHEIVAHFTEKNGLLSNVAYELYYDRNQLWVGQDQGISRIQYPSSINQITENEGLQGTITALNGSEETAYIGTTSGFYEIKDGKKLKLKKMIVLGECMTL